MDIFKAFFGGGDPFGGGGGGGPFGGGGGQRRRGGGEFHFVQVLWMPTLALEKAAVAHFAVVE